MSATPTYARPEKKHLGPVIFLVLVGAGAFWFLDLTYFNTGLARVFGAAALTVSFMMASRINQLTLLIAGTALVPILGTKLQFQALILLLGTILLILSSKKTNRTLSPRIILGLLLATSCIVSLGSGAATRSWLQFTLIPALCFLIGSGIVLSLHHLDTVLLSTLFLSGLYSLLYIGSCLRFWTMPAEAQRQSGSLWTFSFDRVWAPGGPVMVAGAITGVWCLHIRDYRRSIRLPLSVLSLMGVVATQSRSLVLVLLVVAVVVTLGKSSQSSPRLLGFLLIGLISFATFSALPREISLSAASTDQNVRVRLVDWQSVKVPDLLSTLFGSGGSQTEVYWDAGHIQWLYGLGVLGFVWIYATPLILSRYQTRDRAEAAKFRPLANGMTTCLVFTGVSTDLPFSMTFWLLLGLLVAPLEENGSEAELPPQPATAAKPT